MFGDLNKKPYLCTRNQNKNGSVAQLNRASDYGSEGYRFESCRRHKIMQRPVFRQVAFCFRLHDHSAVADSLFLRLVLPPTYTRENFRPPIKSIRNPSVPTPDHSNNFEIPVSEKHLKTNRQNIQILPKRSTKPLSNGNSTMCPLTLPAIYFMQSKVLTQQAQCDSGFNRSKYTIPKKIELAFFSNL